MHVSGSKACNEAKACRQVKQKKKKRNEAATENEDHDRLDETDEGEGRIDANNSWWISELLAADCERSVASSSMEGYTTEMVELVAGNEEEG